MAPRVNPGRIAAARTLLAVERGVHAEEALEQHGPPEGKDRGLAWHLVFGVLRRQGQLDSLIVATAKRDLDKLDAEARIALRLGLFEMHFARTAGHAAVHQAVELVGALGAGRAKGFVNAILRRASSPRIDNPLLNHPGWWVDRWRERCGEEALALWCERNDSEAPLAISMREEEQSHVDAFREAGCTVSPGIAGGRPLARSYLLSGHKGRVTKLPGFAEGRWWVMDPSAVLAVDLLGASPGESVLDACAAPGGKSLRLASSGVKVFAVDASKARLSLLMENFKRMGLPVETRVENWLSLSSAPKTFDHVLIDAPCTGLGTLRRHPEIRWRVLPTDPAAMAIRQLGILAGAAECVRPGGRVLYSVCSPEPEEGRDVVARFLSGTAGYVLEEEVLTAPPSDQEDSFYAARIRREKA